VDGQVRIESRVDAVNARIDQMAMISVPDDKTVFYDSYRAKSI